MALSVYEWFEGIDPAEYTALERLRGKTDKFLTDYTQETWMKPLKITRFVRKLDPTFHRKVFDLNKKSLKISKGQSETVYRRRTDNTMAKRKSTKEQTTIDETYIHIKLKIE